MPPTRKQSGKVNYFNQKVRGLKMLELVSKKLPLREWKTTGDWQRADSISYDKARRLGFLQEIADRLGISYRKPAKSLEETIAILSKLTSKPSVNSKDPAIKKLGQALSKIQQRHPGKYEALLITNPNLNPAVKTLEENLAILSKLTSRPSQDSKDPEIKKLGKALSKIQQRHPGKYEALLITNPALVPTMVFKPIEETIAILSKLNSRPSQDSKDPEIKKLGIALSNVQKRHPDKYEALLITNPNLKPTLKTVEENLAILSKLTSRPSQHSKDPEIKKLGQALSQIQQRHPEKYEALLITNPVLIPRKKSANK